MGPTPFAGISQLKVSSYTSSVCMLGSSPAFTPECFSLLSALVRACKALNQGIGESILSIYVHTYVAVMLSNVDECSTYGFPACGYLHVGICMQVSS